MSHANNDVVVIGAGIAGLMCANFLAQGGKKVLLLEHNHQAGGVISGIWRKGFYFDCGAQAFEQMGIMFPLLEELGLHDPEEWERVNFRFIAKSFGVKADSFDALDEAMTRAYPHDADGIHAYFDEIRAVSEVMAEYDIGDNFPILRKGLLSKGLGIAKLVQSLLFGDQFKMLVKWNKTRSTQLIERLISDPDLQSLLRGLGYRDSSVFNQMMLWHFWVNDYWYPKQGLQAFADGLLEHFKGLGGEVRFHCTVDEILLADGKATGVRTSEGEELTASKVVYCGDYRRLCTSMLPAESQNPVHLRRIKRGAMSEPMVAVYLGLDMSHEELRRTLNTHHTFYCPHSRLKNVWHGSDDLNLHKQGYLSISWTSMTNPGFAPEGQSSLVLQAMSNYAWNNHWGTGGDDSARPQEYREIKETVGDQLIEMLSEIIPGVEERIVYREVGAPQSTIRFTLNAEGASCGWRWDRRLAPIKKPRFRTDFENLYTAGHYTIWPGGVPLSALSGKLVADGILSGYYSESMSRLLNVAAVSSRWASSMARRFAGGSKGVW